MEKKTGKHALLGQLIADGTKYIFGNPGTTEQGFMDALQDYPQLQFILALHEGVAVCAADAYARATRRPAFVELHTAPGLGNGIGMIFNALKGHTPMVVYAGHVETRGLAQEPVLSGDLVGMARSVCKWAYEVQHAHDVPRLLRRAMKVAAEPPQGPVFLSLPMDVLDQEADVVITPTTYTHWRARPPVDAVRVAASMLAAARRPVLLVGDGVSLSEGREEVVALAELLGAPVFGAASTEVNVSFDHPLWAGAVNLLSESDARAQIEAADLLLLIGTGEPATIFPSPAGALPPTARVIQVHLDTWELAKNSPMDLTIVADPKATTAELTEATRGLMSADQQEEARRRRDEVAARRAAEHDRLHRLDQQVRDQQPIAPSRLMEELGAALPANAAIFDESITSGAALSRYVKLMPGRYFRGRGGGIGTGMPGTVGLQLAFPDSPVVGVVADGSAMYTITALWTAAHHKLPVTWVICSNRTYRILKLNMLRYLGESAAGRQFVEMDFNDPIIDFAGMARSLGVHGRQVEKPDELSEALREAIAYPGPALVDVVVDGSLPGRP